MGVPAVTGAGGAIQRSLPEGPWDPRAQYINRCARNAVCVRADRSEVSQRQTFTRPRKIRKGVLGSLEDTSQDYKDHLKARCLQHMCSQWNS